MAAVCGFYRWSLVSGYDVCPSTCSVDALGLTPHPPPPPFVSPTTLLFPGSLRTECFGPSLFLLSPGPLSQCLPEADPGCLPTQDPSSLWALLLPCEGVRTLRAYGARTRLVHGTEVKRASGPGPGELLWSGAVGRSRVRVSLPTPRRLCGPLVLFSAPDLSFL